MSRLLGRAPADPRTLVQFGRYDDRGRLAEMIQTAIDIDTGDFPEPVELEPGTYLILWPGGILCTTPLIVRNRTRFPGLTATW